jgi:mannitol-1-phosphate 5-dehydrogenase
LVPLLSEKAKAYIATHVGFPNAAVDRIVPNQINTDPLLVKVEPFFEWIVDQNTIKGELSIEGMHQSKKLDAYIERKLFTVNTGHATIAYAGYQKGYATIQQSMKDEDVVKLIVGVLGETGALLVDKHGFDAIEQATYIAKTIDRFRNPYMADEVVRVGRSPLRKLSPQDRFIKPLRECIERQLPTNFLEQTIVNAMKYNYSGDEEALKLQALIKEKGARQALIELSGLNPDEACIDRIIKQL